MYNNTSEDVCTSKIMIVMKVKYNLVDTGTWNRTRRCLERFDVCNGDVGVCVCY